MTQMTNMIAPGVQDAGREGAWVLGEQHIEGTFLGMGSSRSDRHTSECWEGCPGGEIHHGEFVSVGHLCSACQWFEARIFRTAEAYVVSTVRNSIVPGDKITYRSEMAYTEFEVIERLSGKRGGAGTFLSKPASRAVAQAAAFDEDLRDAYIDLFGG